MKKRHAKTLEQAISQQIKSGSTIDIRKLPKQAWQALKLPLLRNNHDVLAVFKIRENKNDYWIGLMNWRLTEKYYLVIFGRDGNIKILGEFHKSNGFELQWKYGPTKQDGKEKNEERKQRFIKMYGSTEARISLPTASVSVDDFLTDILRVAEIRRMADGLNADVRFYEDGTFPEGRRIEKLHKSRERSDRVVSEAKRQHAERHNGKLPCEICGFDFQNVYGHRGEHFIEAHHKVPLSKLEEGQSVDTTVGDLALVCANCHRMLHKSPYSTVEELKAKL